MDGRHHEPQCPVCDSSPRVLIAVRHSTMRRLIHELLEREQGCWTPSVIDGDLAEHVPIADVDLVVTDADRFATVQGYPTAQVVVIGREPDPASMSTALRSGAAGWVARDCIADELSQTMRRAMGCEHAPCPRPALVGGRYVDDRSTNPWPARMR